MGLNNVIAFVVQVWLRWPFVEFGLWYVTLAKYADTVISPS